MEIRECLAELVACADLPLSFVEHPKLSQLIMCCQPRAREAIFSADTCKRDIMKLFEMDQKRLLEKLASVRSKKAFTTEIWTSSANVSFCAVTVHYVSDEWNLVSTMLDFFELVEGHDGINISRQFCDSVCDRAGLGDSIIGITLDNASNNNSFVADLQQRVQNFTEDNRFRCFSHAVNLAVQAAIETFNLDVVRIRNHIAAVRRSPMKYAVFKATAETVHPGAKVLKPILDDVTRWNSTYDMLQLSLDQRLIWNAYMESLNDVVDAEYWGNIKAIVDFLEPFKLISVFLCGQQYPAISLVVPAYNSLLKHTDLVRRDDDAPALMLIAADRSYDKLVQYYDVSSELCTIATLLDPRLHLDFYRSDTSDGAVTVDQAMATLTAEYKKYAPTTATVNNGADQVIPTQQNLQAKANRFFFGPRPGSELERYKSMCPVDQDTDIFKWWQANQIAYPTLARMAKDYLCIPATSVPSERAFSLAGLIVADDRCSLASSTIRALTLLKSWRQDPVPVIPELEMDSEQE